LRVPSVAFGGDDEQRIHASAPQIVGGPQGGQGGGLARVVVA